ncbi:hypothetical protein [Embleya sp. MST-111070]|uniref:hypothetical protein n=1 Tax=Embleya sp. MST-111070 TaxID=3398231 RepID=UPI003F73DAEC
MAALPQRTPWGTTSGRHDLDAQVDLAPSQPARLDEVSAIALGNPHGLLAGDHIRTVTTGDLKIDTIV